MLSDSTALRSALGPDLLGRALEACGNGVVIFDLHDARMTVRWVNRELLRMTGRTADEVLGAPVLSLLGDLADQPGVAEAVAAAQAGREFRLTVRMPRGDGGWFWDQVHGAPVAGPDGRAAHLIGIHVDISERIDAEQRLQRARDQALQRIEDFPAPVWRSAPGGSRFHFNRAWLALTGRALEQEIDEGWAEGIHPGDRGRVLAEWAEAHRHDRAATVDYRLRGADGGWRRVSERGVPVQDADGCPSGFLGVCTDLTERRDAEDALAWAHARLAAVIDSLPLFLISEGADGRIELWNRVAEQVFGIPAREAVGTPLRGLPLGIDWDQADARSEGSAAPAADLDDLTMRRPDGGTALLSLRILPFGGTAESGRLWTGSDVTELRRLESHLAQDQKLQSIGQLAAGIAHEINTPMQFVGDNTRFLSDAFASLAELIREQRAAIEAAGLPAALAARVEAAERKADLGFLLDEAPRAIAQTLDGIERVTRIVKAMKEFSHPGSEELTPTDLNHAIESTATVSRNEWKYVADLELDLDPSLAPVPVLPGGFNQVVLNLVVNAAHAIADVAAEGGAKGRITIATRELGDSVEVAVTDTGTGIPESIRGRIFDPFFTTKEVGRGTGQGLAIVRGQIVSKLGGSIRLRSATEGPERGTTFTLAIPRHRPTAQVRRKEA